MSPLGELWEECMGLPCVPVCAGMCVSPVCMCAGMCVSPVRLCAGVCVSPVFLCVQVCVCPLCACAQVCACPLCSCVCRYVRVPCVPVCAGMCVSLCVSVCRCVCVPCVRVCAGMCVSPVGLCMHSHACVYVPCGCLLCKCVYLCVMACVCPSVGVCKCTCVCVFWSQTRSYLCRVITLSGLVAFGEPGVGVALELIIAWPWSCPQVKSQWVICRVLFPYVHAVLALLNNGPRARE